MNNYQTVFYDLCLFLDYHNEGTECQVTSCEENYFSPLENSKTMCKNNSWTSVLKCQLSQTPCLGSPAAIGNAEIVCDDDDLVDGGSGYFEGTKCSFSCHSGYVPKPESSKPQVQCNNGVWQYSYTCVKGKYGSDLILQKLPVF